MWQRAKMLINSTVRPRDDDEKGQDRIANRTFWVHPPIGVWPEYDNETRPMVFTNVTFSRIDGGHNELRPVVMDGIELQDEFSTQVETITWEQFTSPADALRHLSPEAP